MWARLTLVAKLVVIAAFVFAWSGVLLSLPACAGNARSVHHKDGMLARLESSRGPAWPRRHVLEAALRAWECGSRIGLFDPPLLTIIDYSLPSTERRLWVVDLAEGRVLFRELVAHGVNSGENHAVAFSNQPDSRQSSLGLFRTEETYTGRHGLSLRLEGLEPGINDRARERAIVFHGAAYVSAPFIAEHGRLGRSWGCPALDEAVRDRIIERIQGGTAVFAYHSDDDWLRESPFQSCDRHQS